MRARAGVLAMVIGILALDQGAKLLVASRLAPGDSLPLLPGLVHLTLVRNSGMAFGLLSAAAIPHKPAVVTLLSVAALIAVAAYALRSPANERLSQAGLALILGGAAGNIVDRIRLGYVIDYVDAFYGGSHWPAFNLADAAICTGVGLLLLDTLRHREPAKAPAQAGSGEG